MPSRIVVGLILMYEDFNGAPIAVLINQKLPVVALVERGETFTQAIGRSISETLGSAMEKLARRHFRTLYEIHCHKTADEDQRIFLLKLPRSPIPFMRLAPNEIIQISKEDLNTLEIPDYERSALEKTFHFTGELL